MNPSPNWSRAMPPGPDARVKITEAYAKHVAHDAYFWAWPLVNMYNFFVPNEINRYSVGTKNRDLRLNPDGSLTIFVQADSPPEAQRANWLPAPKGEDFSLFMRAYWPKAAALDGSWTPPAVTPVP